MRDSMEMARFAIRLALEDGFLGRELSMVIRQEQRAAQRHSATVKPRVYRFVPRTPARKAA